MSYCINMHKKTILFINFVSKIKHIVCVCLKGFYIRGKYIEFMLCRADKKQDIQQELF